jgi:cytochrome P450
MTYAKIRHFDTNIAFGFWCVYRMPYTEAVLLETLRYGTLIPIIPRSNNKETTINGCYIPKVNRHKYLEFETRVFWDFRGLLFAE